LSPPNQVYMTGMVAIFLVTFLVFDASESDLDKVAFYESAPEERKLFFGSLRGLLALTQQVLMVGEIGSLSKHGTGHGHESSGGDL